MKHSVKITLVLLVMFFITQLIGLVVLNNYSPQTSQVIGQNGSVTNVTSYNLPYGMDPPQGIEPRNTLISIIFAIAFAVAIMLILMRIKAELLLRTWFLVVVALAIGITVNSFLIGIEYGALISLAVAIPLALLKVFNRNIFIHNISELLIYPGIASIFVPLLNIWTVVVLLIVISIYDIYAVWHAGFMQKMAKYQIQKLKVFSGFFIPYVSFKDRRSILKSGGKKDKKVKVSVAILGGGDVVFPIILAGVVLRSMGLIPALIIAVGATLALAGLFYMSEKGKFYPAMPFISAGCFIALGIVYLIRFI